MRNKGKKLMALFAASLFAFTFTLSACETTTPPPVTNTDEWEVVLDYNDEVSRPRTTYVEKGKAMAKPANPLREGYELADWTTEKTGGSAVSFPYSPTGNTTLYAQWDAAKYDVTFDYNYEGAPEAHVTQVEYNKTVEQAYVDGIEIPERNGFEFRYWQTRAEEGERVAWPFTVKKDVTFYAYWIGADVKIFTVTFDANYEEGQTFEPIEVEQGDTVSQRQAPDLSNARPGYNFLGWSTNPEATSKNETITFPYEPTENDADQQNVIKLYAVWQRGTYSVRFMYNYTGSPGAPTYVYKNVTGVLGADTIDAPEPPTRSQDGYTFQFDGWYTTASGGEKIEFPYAVYKTENFYAHWIAPETSPSNNIFDAEFTPIDANTFFPGYSGGSMGKGCIQSQAREGSTSQAYPLIHVEGEDAPTHIGHYVYSLYRKGLTLTFKIRSDKAVSNATLYANLAPEILEEFTITPEGDFGYQFIVNGTSLNYGSITISGGANIGGGMYMGSFKEYKISNISLKEGWNTIELVTNNSNKVGGGTMEAIAPMVDYIRIEATGAILSWNPVYDNLY